MTEPWWVSLLREQQAAGFADVAGARASILVPVDDRLATRLIAGRLPSSWPVKELDLRAAAGNQIAVRLRLSRPAFLPPLTIRLTIERQPVLPSSPVLVLRFVLEGMAALAGPALRFLQVLPAGLRLEGDLLYVNVATLLERYGAGEGLAYFEGLELTTAEGRMVIAARLAVPGA